MAKQQEPHGQQSAVDAAPVAEIDWCDVLKQHQHWLRTAVLARVGDATAVADVMQDVALAAIENASRLRNPQKVKPWLYRLAVVAALQYRRRMGRRRKLADRYKSRLHPTEENSRHADGLAWLVNQELRSLVQTALNSLPGRDAEILLLKYTQDWSYRQLSEHLGISVSAVESRLHRARAKLRSALWSLDRSLASTGA